MCFLIVLVLSCFWSNIKTYKKKRHYYKGCSTPGRHMGLSSVINHSAFACVHIVWTCWRARVPLLSMCACLFGDKSHRMRTSGSVLRMCVHALHVLMHAAVLWWLLPISQRSHSSPGLPVCSLMSHKSQLSRSCINTRERGAHSNRRNAPSRSSHLWYNVHIIKRRASFMKSCSRNCISHRLCDYLASVCVFFFFFLIFKSPHEEYRLLVEPWRY